MSHLRHKSQALRTQSLIKTAEAILVIFAAIFVTAILPSLLIQYVFSGQALFEQPPVLQYIPVVSFVIGIGYFIYAMVGNILREGKARRYDLEAEAMGDDCGCGHDHSDLAELEAMLDEVESQAEMKSSPARKTTRKAGKKTAKKSRK
ncbi:MAG TPA: hypothetical protein VF209_01975 [Patescibacteria group bacterium]